MSPLSRVLFQIFVFLLFNSSLYSQGWEINLGGINDEHGNAVLQRSDGSFAIAGFNGTSFANAWLVHIDPDGKVTDSDVFGNSSTSDHFIDLTTTADGGYALLGYTETFGIQKQDYFFVRTTIQGDTLFTRSFGGTENDVGKSILATSEGGFALLGYSESFGTANGKRDFHLIRTDENGNALWTQSYGDEQDDWGLKILAAANNGFFLIGRSYHESQGSLNTWLIKTNESGDTIRTYRYPEFYVADAITAPDGDLILAGHTYPFSGLPAQVALMKVDTNGVIKWSKDYGNPDEEDYANAVEFTEDGGFILSGFSETGGSNEAFLMKTDSSGFLEWNRNYGGNGFEEAVDVIQAADGGFVFSGVTQSFSAGGDDLYLVKTSGEGISVSNYIQGTIYLDRDINCEKNTGDVDLSNWIVKAAGNSIYYGTTDESGNYSIRVDTGSYQVEVIIPNDYWVACQSVFQLAFSNPHDSIGLDFPLQAVDSCPVMNVDIGLPFLRRCFENVYTLSYCNEGTADATAASMEVSFDPAMEVLGSSLPWVSTSGNIYTFDLGNVAIGDCNEFQVTILLDCDSTVLGQTHCTEARIFPDSICLPAPPLWDGSSLKLTADCEGDSLAFRIINEGSSMSQERTYIVIEDHVLLRSEPFQLPTQGSLLLKLPANGSTYRLEAQQDPAHPLTSVASIATEACGTNTNGEFSIGFVNQYPDDDDYPFLAIDCRESIGSFDPNDKLAFPKGITDDHCIAPGIEIEYLLRFQNTGTDTAFRVVIRDTLSPLLNIQTVRPGSGNHPFTFEILESNILKFTFDNILLPDSSDNEPASHGFVRFVVQQFSDNPLGMSIHNQASIWFDYNAPILTNQTEHLIDTSCLSRGTTSSEAWAISSQLDYKLELFPNPVDDILNLYFQSYDTTVREIQLLNLIGQHLQTLPMNISASSNTFSTRIRLKNLAGGTYLLKLKTDVGMIVQKFVKR